MVRKRILRSSGRHRRLRGYCRRSRRIKDPIKIGLLEDQSGEIAIFTMPKVRGTQLAVEEINAAGGILGRQLELIAYDPQFDNAKFQEFTRRLIERDEVDVLFAGATSASREAVRPIVDRTDILYFYTNQYEGGVCDANMIGTGGLPEQQFSTLIPWMMEKYGKRVYTIAADYNFGQISAEWTRKLVNDNGGEIVGEELIPLGVSQFGQTIQNIQKAKPDWLMSLFVGNSQSSFYEQAPAAGLEHPDGQLDHHRPRLRAQALQAAGDAEHARRDELVRGARHRRRPRSSSPAGAPSSRTRPTSTTWARTPMPRSTSTRSWSRWRARPSSTPIREQIATGEACIDAPEGQICIDPKSQHVTHRMWQISVDASTRSTVERSWDRIEPYWLGEIGCDLTKDDPKEQYTPSYLPQQ